MFQKALFTLVFFLTFFCQEIFATHGAGLDISYECISRGVSADNYRIVIKYYRDCSSSSPAANNFMLDYSSSCGSGSAFLPQVAGPVFITPLCSGSSSPCNNNNLVELEEYIYETSITLSHCSDWVINVCASGNRNNAITTIINPANQDLCVEAEINNLNYCNNSPSFSEYPAPYICAGQTYCYNNGAIDVDGDSLMYSLTTPLNGWGVVTYVAGFSPSNPISGTTTFDEFNGDLCMNATQNQVSVIAMKITEYRNGIKIGSVMRDIQIIVLACSTTPPVLTGFNGVPQNVTNATALDDSLHFCATGSDNINLTIESPLGSSNNKTMSWSGISGVSSASFTISNNNSSNPFGTFSWTPQYVDVLNSPYTFTVTVEDDACPVNNLFSYTYTISLSSALDFDVVVNSIDPSCSGYNDGSVDLIVAGITGSPSFNWTGPNSFVSTSQNVNSLFAGLYFVVISDDAGCILTDTVEIFDPNNLNINYSIDSVSCIGSNDGVIDITIIPNTNNFTYSWVGPNGFTSTNQDINNLYSGVYVLTVLDGSGCSYDYTVIIPSANPFNVSTNVDSISCFDQADGVIDLSLSINTSQLIYSWTGPNGFSSSDEDLDSLNPGIYQIVITDQNGCTFIDSVILENPDSIFSISNINSCDNYIWNNINYTNSGTHTYSTIASNSCDSTAILNLIINNSNTSLESKTACDQYQWNGTTYFTTGIYNYDTINILGCDSIASLDLIINNSSFSNTVVKDCKPYLWNGNVYDVSGLYTYTTTNLAGCDSIANLDLQITSYSMSAQTPICKYDTSDLVINITDPASNIYSITISDLVNSYNFTVDSSGLLLEGTAIELFPQNTTQYILTYVVDGNNCESYPDNNEIIIVNPLPVIELPLLEVCVNEPPFFLNYATPAGGDYFINNQFVSLFKPSVFNIGDHLVRYEYTDSATTCNAIKEEDITILPQPISDFYCSSYLVKQDTPIVFFSTSNEYTSLYWIIDDELIINDSISFSYTYPDTGVYTVQLITLNEYNCSDTAVNDITILPSYTVYIPNTFSPNDNNINDVFFPKGEGIKEYRITIFNRWGENIFKGEKNSPWGGENVPEGKYAYMIEILNLRNRSFKYVGNILLLKSLE